MGANQQTPLTPLLPATGRPSSTHTAKEVSAGSNYLSQLPLAYDCRHDEYPMQHTTSSSGYKNSLHDVRSSFKEIPESQATAMPMPTIPHEARLQQQPDEMQRSPQQSPLPIICVDDETIVLTEDEEDTLVSSHDYNEEIDDEDDDEDEEAAAVLANRMTDFRPTTTMYVDASSNESQNRCARESVDNEEMETADEEEEYVDILGNDDDDLNPLNSANFTQRLQCQELEEEIAKSGKALTRNKLIYDNEELHHRAINGLAKLFEKDFLVPHVEKRQDNNLLTRKQTNTVLTAINEADLSEHIRAAHVEKPPAKANSFGRTHQQRSHKSERKRMKLRKHHQTIDEETISPVSGTIIRKLRDDEELVVRKGDIDPAFNVVEITEEAKAILASIDNKIGDYLCQLCRTLYDDAFQLAQHRCPRIVHIEYKCSECEKVAGANFKQFLDNQFIYFFFCLGLQLSR